MTNWILKGGAVFHETGRELAGVAIYGETIFAIKAPDIFSDATEIVDVPGW